MTSRKEQAERSRSRLVDAALRLFVEHGYEATSVSQILEATGMAKGALYHHFPGGKRELFGEAVEVADHAFHEGLDRIVETVDSPVGRITAGWKLVLDLATDPVFAKIVLVEAQAVAPEAWTGASQFQLLRATLEEAIAAGEIRPVPLDAATATLFGAIRRMADYVAVADDPGAAARDGDAVLHALLEGLRP
ncbi:MAG TPA: TetR family transcriptional regulator [Iamia sp.]|nr:TetR family transcriptional regulator [Iamia sp.]